MKKYISILSIILMTGSMTYSQSSWKFRHDHQLGLQSFRFFTTLDAPHNVREVFSNHAAKLSYKTNFSLYAKALTRFNSKDGSRSRIFLNEAYLNGHIRKLNYKLGKQSIRWGSITGYSSLDMVNRQDFYDFIDGNDEDLGQWALSLKTEHKAHQFNFRIIPYTQPSRLYFDKNNWIRLPNQLPHPTEAGQHINALMSQLDTFGLDHSISFGLEWKLTVKDSEFLVSYYQGLNDAPLRRLRIEEMDDPIKYATQLIYYDINILAIAHSHLLDEWTLNTEISWIQNKLMNEIQQLETDGYGTISLSMDRVFFFEDPEKLLKFICQYRYSFLGDDGPKYTATDLDHILDHVLISKLDYNFNYQWKLNAKTVISLSEPACLQQIGLSWKVSEQFTTNFRMDVLWGKSTHFFGHYSDMDRFSFQIKCEL